LCRRFLIPKKFKWADTLSEFGSLKTYKDLIISFQLPEKCPAHLFIRNYSHRRKGGIKLPGSPPKFVGSCWKVLFSAIKNIIGGAWLCSSLKNGQLIFAYYRVLRYRISVKPLHRNLPFFLPKTVNTLDL